LLDDKNILSKSEENWANRLGLYKHFKENFELYHALAEHFHDKVTVRGEKVDIRTIARLIGTLTEYDDDFIKLLHKENIKKNTYDEIMVKDLIGLIALSNGDQ